MSNEPSEQVNHPAHYGGENNSYEAIKVIEAWELNFNLGNTVKYLNREKLKGGLTDLKKARWYLQREIDTRERIERQRRLSSMMEENRRELYSSEEGRAKHTPTPPGSS